MEAEVIKKRNFISLVLTFSLLLTTNAFAGVNIGQQQLAGQGATAVQKMDFVNHHGEEIDISGYTKARGNYLVEGGILNHSDSLTTADPTDIYFFTNTGDRSLFLQTLTSSSYVTEIASVDWASGNMSLTGVTIPANQTISINVPSGDWALYVHSTDNVLGGQYTTQFNVTNPANYTSEFFISKDLSICIVQTGSVYYYNGVFISTSNIRNQPIEWEFHEEYSIYNPSHPTSPGTGFRDLKISYGTIKSINVGIFKTNKMTIPHALYIMLDAGTLWSYNNSEIVAGSYNRTTIDYRGLTTPRYFDEIDVGSPDDFGDQILIYDLDQQQYVNFFSIYNPYFSSGAESLNSESWYLKLQ